MFGFPTRVRSLYHSEPRRLPAEEAIGRNLEIALSQFAPGSQTVKDKTVHTSVGVVDYHWDRGRVVTGDGRGFRAEVGKCDTCGALLANPGPDEQTCSICGSSFYACVEAWEPKDFMTEPGGETDFDGSFDWTPRAGAVRLCSDTPRGELHVAKGTNLAYSSMEGEVRSVNDNGGDLFQFEKLRSPRVWVVRGELQADWQETSTAGSGVSVALLAKRFAELLLLRQHAVPAALELSRVDAGGVDAGGVYARAAYLSWGFLLRSAACASLDIDTDELEVNIRPVRERGGTCWEVYLMDRLENGAGYASHLAQESNLRRHLLDPLLPGGSVRELLVGDDHAECDSSCYDCLRDYYNGEIHSILDWRLGLDLAELAADGAFVPSLSAGHWTKVVDLAQASLQRILGEGQPGRFGGLPGLLEPDGRPQVLLVHPLWSMAHPAVVNATKIEGTSAQLCNIFDALRRPGWLVARLASERVGSARTR